uniref:Uncharacterized protein n=1 Tax=Haloferax volcanii (strain ATCC 29605 / DSM 3757 / JCM 8879 / NBRC 14742 / NCIMB 2012 / VKM B-1768 / DS2) TaxID=309800 RepID=D4H0A9_HALVD
MIPYMLNQERTAVLRDDCDATRTAPGRPNFDYRTEPKTD